MYNDKELSFNELSSMFDDLSLIFGFLISVETENLYF